MDPNILYIIIGVAALIVGLIVGKLIFAKDTSRKVAEAELQSQTILREAELRAETIRKEKELEAKERFVQMKAAHDKEIFEKNKKINDSENRAKQKEQSVTQKEVNLDKQIKENDFIKKNLKRQIKVGKNKKTKQEKKNKEKIRRLEKIAGLSAEEAKNQLIEGMRSEAHTQGIGIQQEIIDDAKQKANKEARKIIIQTIQRTAAEQAIENTITVFNLESDEIKGQIIGREGRNIRALEATTGVDLIIGDTSEAMFRS